MRLSDKYNRANLFTSLIVLIITGIVYYVVIHFILTERLDRDLAVEENEIRQYTNTYKKLPLPASYIDQQISFKVFNGDTTNIREFTYTTYLNPKDNEVEPGRMLITTVQLNGKVFLATITKSRVESEDLVRIILLITLGVTMILLIALIFVNRFLLNRLWQPFFTILNRMKGFEVAKMENIQEVPTPIDEFNELNKSVNEMAAKVKQDYKELKSFTDNASHEMMTPLAVINSKLDSLLQTGSFSQPQGALLEDIYHATGRLSRLHQSLLLLAKIENHLIADVQHFDLKELIEAKIRQFQELFERIDLHLESTLENCSVEMSRYLADILLNNLIGNAIRHNHHSGQIKIKLSKDQLIISNTGKNKQIQQNLFDRFSKSAESEGMGLGLAISKQICQLYGFEIIYEYIGEEHFFTVQFNSKD
ncbi:sensor histidine kinase [Pedobacter rhizosphaerae]|uniref:histidine kinase n=1 Tax=Pedobacter rhizosphaerae TaxID=390241 RepID=A0A1H9U8F0_9SPHI|nr:HAMP domain-containing sensor histidine kinase [Pedobacter rhizosphaerae]SES05427.1 Signal transduction histidine kinase [Pedobacter rhizosphaerae]